MKRLELKNFGVVEMDAMEMREVDGGLDWWGHVQNAFNRLNDDVAGQLACAVFPGHMLGAIAVGGTINYIREKCS